VHEATSASIIKSNFFEFNHRYLFLDREGVYHAEVKLIDEVEEVFCEQHAHQLQFFFLSVLDAPNFGTEQERFYKFQFTMSDLAFGVFFASLADSFIILPVELVPILQISLHA